MKLSLSQSCSYFPLTSHHLLELLTTINEADNLFTCKFLTSLFSFFSGQYGESSNGTCSPCQSSCKQCDSVEPNKCTSCPMGKFFYMHQCISSDQCPTGTFANTTSGICENCQLGCTSCSHSSSLKCLACSEGFVMHKSQCLMRCPEGTFPRHSNRSALECLL